MEAFCAASCDTLAQGRGRYTTNENKLIQINELKNYQQRNRRLSARTLGLCLQSM